MSNFIRHEPCPKCGSKDNLGVFDDGHKWCFGCGYFEASSTTLKEVSDFYEKKEEPSSPYKLPYDFTQDIPKEPYTWLKQYGITNAEIMKHRLGWSNSKQMLIFPFYGEDNEQLIIWQGRFFPARKPKTITYGYPERELLIQSSSGRGPNSLRVVAVEDAVSSIKVSRQVDCTVLLGSNVSLQKAHKLSRYYSHLTLWLDNDKIKEMSKFWGRYRYLFETMDFIISDKDPKAHTDEEIKEYLK